MSRGTASCGIVFPDGKQRNNTRKMCRLLFPADEVRERLVCPQPRSLPPHPHPLFQCHSWAAYPLRGLQMGVPVLQPQCGGTAKGPFALAGLTLLYQLSEIPGLPCCCQPPRSPDLVLTPQLTSWLLSIYSSPTPRLLPAFPKSSRSGAASLLQAPAQGCWPETDAARNPCFHTHTPPPKHPLQAPWGKGLAPLWSPAVRMLLQPLEHLGAGSVSAEPSREMGQRGGRLWLLRMDRCFIQTLGLSQPSGKRGCKGQHGMLLSCFPARRESLWTPGAAATLVMGRAAFPHPDASLVLCQHPCCCHPWGLSWSQGGVSFYPGRF